MRRYTVRINGTDHTLDVEETARDQFVVQLGDKLVDVTLVDHEDLAQAQIAPAVEVGTPRALPDAIPSPAAPPGPTPPAAPAAVRPRTSGIGRNAVTAPMPGVVLSVAVAPGQTVARGDLLAVLEAMKMKNDLRAERDGVIASVAVAPGDQVKHGDPMIAYEG